MDQVFFDDFSSGVDQWTAAELTTEPVWQKDFGNPRPSLMFVGGSGEYGFVSAGCFSVSDYDRYVLTADVYESPDREGYCQIVLQPNTGENCSGDDLIPGGFFPSPSNSQSEWTIRTNSTELEPFGPSFRIGLNSVFKQCYFDNIRLAGINADSTPAAIPTVSAIGKMMLALLLVGCGIAGLRRRRHL